MLAPAGLLALVAIIFKMHWIIELILCILSSAIACLELIAPAKAALTGRKLSDPLLIILLACLISFCTGAYISAALTLIVYRLSLMYMKERYINARLMAKTRAELSGLKAYMQELEDKPQLSLKLHRLAEKYLTLAAAILALLYAVLLPLLSEVSVAAALKNAAVILAVSGIFSLTLPFTLVDFAAVVRAGECGILLRPGALKKILNANLLYADVEAPAIVEGVKAMSSDPAALSPKSVIFLAASAYSYSTGEISQRLAEAYGKPIDRSSVSEAQEIEGLGVIAKIRGTTVCAGSAVFMNRIGLPVVPFPDYGSIVHVGVNGRYAGWISLDGEDGNDDNFKQEAEKLGLKTFDSANGIYDKLGVGDVLIYAANKEFQPGIATKKDVRAIIGAYNRMPGTEADIYTAACSKKAVLDAVGFVRNAELIKKGCFIFSGVIKALVLVLALLGLMPLWTAVLADTAAAAFSCAYGLRALDLEQ